MSRELAHARGRLALDRCRVMGIVNRTPDSFYDGGRMGLSDSLRHAEALVAAGADLLDIGAVKAGPGVEVSEEEEMERLLPLVTALGGSVPVSVETSRPRVAEAAIGAGAALVNEVGGLVDPSLARVCARTGAALILMHNGGQIRGRPRHPRFDDIVATVRDWFHTKASVAIDAGVPEDALVFDPGLDFGITTFHSLELMRRLEELTAGPVPVLVAPSCKDIVGESLGLPPSERLEGTLALVALATRAGAAMVRVHDVHAAVRVVRMVEAVLGRRPPADPVRGLWD